MRHALTKQAKAEEAFTKAAEDLSKYTRGKMYSGLDPVYFAKVTKAAYYAAAEGIRDFQVFLAKLKLQKFAKAVELSKLDHCRARGARGRIQGRRQGVRDRGSLFTLAVPFVSGTSKRTIGSQGELMLEGRALGAGAKHAEVFQQLGLSHAYKGHGAKRDVLTIANEALQNAAKPSGAGMSSVWASDEAMLRGLEGARAEVAAGRGARSGACTLVDHPTTPSTGRVFIAKSKMPAGVTPLNETPFAALPDVAELPVTHVPTLFTETRPGASRSSTFSPCSSHEVQLAYTAPPAPVAPVADRPTRSTRWPMRARPQPWSSTAIGYPSAGRDLLSCTNKPVGW